MVAPSTLPRARCRSLLRFLGLIWLSCCMTGCEDNRRRETQRAEQAINASKTKSDSLRDATGYLAQMTPLNRDKIVREVQLHLNKWLQTASAVGNQATSQDLLNGLPPDIRSATGIENLANAPFDEWDVEYLYQCQIFRKLTRWISSNPLRDSLLNNWFDKQAGQMPPADLSQLEQACKLFDWSVRNIVLQGNAKDVEQLIDDPRAPIIDNGIGYGYLPWQTILFGRGDFVERGRVFTALAQQVDLPTVWLALRLPTSPSAKLWAIGVLIGEDCYVFDPKLGLPILNPDTLALATLADIQNDERILRRLDVPGRFDYAVNPGDAKKIEFLIEAEPSCLSDRMAMLQASLTGESRLALQVNQPRLVERLTKLQPEAPLALWQTPLLARLYAINLRGRLEMNSPFTMQYMVEHAFWFMNTPASVARFKHLNGEFENTFDARGALATYMDCRLPDEQINRLLDDPDTQKELGIPRNNAETMEEYQLRLRQYQAVFRQSKIDVSFLLGQLHFDLGNFDEVEGWLLKRTLPNTQAARWHWAARYTLGRVYQQQQKMDEAFAQFNEDGSPMEAGNRLRVRYLTR